MPQGRSLQEMSEGDGNARAGSAIPLPTAPALKHKLFGLPEPTTKRKTLAERAEEFQKPSKPVHSQPKSSAFSTYRYPSSTSNTSGSVASRVTSASSFAAAAGSSARPQSQFGSFRLNSTSAPTRHAKSQSVSCGRGNGHVEPAHSVQDDSTPGRRPGMITPLPSPSPASILCNPKVRWQREQPAMAFVTRQGSYCGSGRPAVPASAKSAYRSLSVTERMAQLSLASAPTPTRGRNGHAMRSGEPPCTPSYIPKRVVQENKQPWDYQGRLEDMEKQFNAFKQQGESTASERISLQDQTVAMKSKVHELEAGKRHISSLNNALQLELDTLKTRYNQASLDLDIEHRRYRRELDETETRYQNDLHAAKEEHRLQLQVTRQQEEEKRSRLLQTCRNDTTEAERRLEADLANEKGRLAEEIRSITAQSVLYRHTAELEAASRENDISESKAQAIAAKAECAQLKSLNASLRETLAEASSSALVQETTLLALHAKINFLESDTKAQSQAFADLNQKTQEAVERAAEAHTKLRTEETLRRKLHNQIQELKGNIRVFCRVRPAIEQDALELAKISFPDTGEDSKELSVLGPERESVLGKDTTSKNDFSFDRVFGPLAENMDVFGEISQLVQSALDGYNVCIFCYGQTGSGKTHTMSSSDGMIPLAVNQIYGTATELRDKSWTYTMEGSFVEVYNENLNDLLGSAEDIDNKKLDIRHDSQAGKTTIVGVTSVALESPGSVSTLLARASANRSVAATKANERSSRSHAIFILKLIGENPVTGERSEGTLNLVDLAGSERVAHSGATGERLKETQNINRSLSCLADVVSALGQGKEGAHIPYRNSKLTYLLQHSLGGNSKTLMFVMVSPLQAHLSETLTSLKFATKVHNTYIGTAKRQVRTKK